MLATQPIRRKQRRSSFGGIADQVHFVVTSRQIVRDLLALGVTENKTKRVRLPIFPPSLAAHFFRGLVDADGYLSRYRIRGQSGHYWALGLVGNLHIVTAFREFCRTVQPRIRGNVRNHKTIYEFSVMGRQNVQAVSSALYDNAGIALNRKRRLHSLLLADVAKAAARRDVPYQWVCDCGDDGPITTRWRASGGASRHSSQQGHIAKLRNLEKEVAA